MKTDKDVKVHFFILTKKNWRQAKDEKTVIYPLYEINDIILYVKKLLKLKKFFDLQDNKFCFLESVSSVNEGSNIVFKGFFKSARNEFRPNLLNKKTGEERSNPKLLTEGDIEKTHFVIKIDKAKQEVYLLLEYNFYGVSINNIIDYFTHFLRQYLKTIKRPRNFTIVQAVIPGNDFFDELQRLGRAKIAEVYFDKQLLGSKALNFSNRTLPLKQDLKLVATADLGESIKEVAVDLFNAFSLKGSNITKVRVFGNDSDNNEVVLDTSFMSRIEYVKVDLNLETGEVITSQMISGLIEIAERL